VSLTRKHAVQPPSRIGLTLDRKSSRMLTNFEAFKKRFKAAVCSLSIRFVSGQDSSYSFQFNETAPSKGRDQNVSRRSPGTLATDRVSGWIEPVAQESVVDSALLRSDFRPFKTAFLYTSCTQKSSVVSPCHPSLSGKCLHSKNKAKPHTLCSASHSSSEALSNPASACDDLLPSAPKRREV
jgi:hypothetical protein